MLIADPLMLETALLIAVESGLLHCHLAPVTLSLPPNYFFFFAGEHTADILWDT